eukprot:5166344-Pleurochrysis_carterae.AAC.6
MGVRAFVRTPACIRRRGGGGGGVTRRGRASQRALTADSVRGKMREAKQNRKRWISASGVLTGDGCG